MLKNLHMLLFKRKTLEEPILVFSKMASNMYNGIYKNYHMNYVYVQKYYNIYIHQRFGNLNLVFKYAITYVHVSY